MFHFLLTSLLTLASTTSATLQSAAAEELVLESPSHINALFKSSIKEYSEQQKDIELGTARDKWGRRKMGEGCSKNVPCASDKERCSKIGRCRLKDSTVSDACFYGFITCASEKGSPLRKRAENEANLRLASTPSQEQQTLYHALLPGRATNMMALPAPADEHNNDASSTSYLLVVLHHRCNHDRPTKPNFGLEIGRNRGEWSLGRQWCSPFQS